MVVTIAIPVSAMSALVIESTCGIDYCIGNGCADQHFCNPVTIMVSARTERYHQADRYTGGNEPAWDRIGNQSPFSGVHDVVSEPNYAATMHSLA